MHFLSDSYKDGFVVQPLLQTLLCDGCHIINTNQVINWICWQGNKIITWGSKFDCLSLQPTGLAKGSVDKGASTKKEELNAEDERDEKPGGSHTELQGMSENVILRFLICLLFFNRRQRRSIQSGLIPCCRGNAKWHRM